VGLAAADYAYWNRRLVLWHLYVAPAVRGRGLGTTLLESVIGYARGVKARCVWLETQNVNVPAIRFYGQRGFRLCGLDTRLYDPAGPVAGETALFFALDLD
jgi:ribosomal protein S18 acetylase RimI-like enzyme